MSGQSLDAFEASLVEVYPKLLAYLRRIDAQNADDYAQETIVRAMLARETFDGAHVYGWLYTIARNVLYKARVRRAKWEAPWDDDMALALVAEPTQEASIAVAQATAILAKAGPCGDAYLRHAQEASMSEIAHDMGLSKTHVHRLIAKAKELVKEIDQ